ncbi:MAG: DUF4389 domain-containing protein [Chloroflexota bacterium]|nr:DUF4389 domain-containing protein [Chloroflexota bacterium]
MATDAMATDANEETQGYPLEIRGEYPEDPSRWLWLVKWFLAIPHFIILILLTVVTIIVWIIAIFAILFTARYPQGLFNFTVGVSRWWWRVSFYCGVLGTDRYPPFSLATDDDYPADLYVRYPERLSRLRVVFKWWLMALPHYIVLSLIGYLGLALSIFAGVVMLFTKRYPGDMFGVQMAFNRWNWRVQGYISLWYDDYPPFEFDARSG